MKHKDKLGAALILGAAVLATGVANSSDARAMEAGMEKCYGVVKASMNDCGTDRHSCAGNAAKDGDEHEWVAVPQGLCERLAGGIKGGEVSEADTEHDHDHED